jgi:serine/threonine protein kinase
MSRKLFIKISKVRLLCSVGLKLCCVVCVPNHVIGQVKRLCYKNPVTSHVWAAPERLKHDGQPSYGADIWALGMVFLEIDTGQIPYAHSKDEKLIRFWIQRGDLPSIPEDRRRSIPDLVALSLDSCLNKTPERRPSAESVFERMKIPSFR